MREVFERSILDEPGEPAHYAAFADWLQDQGDPRGEFVRVQLALEDARVAPGERSALKEREAELLGLHERGWLGALAPHLLDGGETTPRVEYGWRRGFLSSVRAQCLTMAFAHALVDEPAARFLDELRVLGEAREYDSIREQDTPPPRVAVPVGVGGHWELLELIGAPCLRNLRVFQMGDPDGERPWRGWTDCYTSAPGLEHVIAGMPRVEEMHLRCRRYDADRLFALPNLGRLRVLHLYHLGVNGSDGERREYPYPLDVLAANPAMANLTHLLFHPHMKEFHYEEYRLQQETGRKPSFLPLGQIRALLNSPHLPRLTHLQLRLSNMGDEGVRAIVDSGILARLRNLDLRHGCITDRGAGLFARCPQTRHLEHLDLSRNAVSANALARLKKKKIKARADNPLTPDELADEAYLHEGDGE